jgi:2-polyprenyl-6-methoxyphenol hydroxylase-like FAD-dependent oxidoreductase
MDPITGQGIGNAMCDAEVLAGAVVSALDGSGNPAHALRRFHKWRDRTRTAMYEMTSDISSFQANPRGDALFEMLVTNEPAADRFLGVLTGVVRPDVFFSPVQMIRMLGIRRTVRLVRGATAA